MRCGSRYLCHSRGLFASSLLMLTMDSSMLSQGLWLVDRMSLQQPQNSVDWKPFGYASVAASQARCAVQLSP